MTGQAVALDLVRVVVLMLPVLALAVVALGIVRRLGRRDG